MWCDLEKGVGSLLHACTRLLYSGRVGGGGCTGRPMSAVKSMRFFCVCTAGSEWVGLYGEGRGRGGGCTLPSPPHPLSHAPHPPYRS